MTRAEINEHLSHNGITASEVARKARVHRTMVDHVIARRHRSRHIEDLLAACIGKTHQEVFPEYHKPEVSAA